MTKLRKGAGGRWLCSVDGDEYEFPRWGAKKSTEALTEIMDLAGKPLGILISNVLAGQGLKTQVNADMAQTILSALTRRMRKNKQDVIRIMEMLTADEVFCNGKQVRNFDLHYEGRLAHMFRVAWAGLEVQYGELFADVRDALGLRADERRADLTPASVTSTG